MTFLTKTRHKKLPVPAPFLQPKAGKPKFRRLQQRHVLAIMLACYFAGLYFWMQVNDRRQGFTPVAKVSAGEQGWPMLTSTEPAGTHFSPAIVNAICGFILSVCVGVAVCRIGRREGKITTRDLLILTAACSFVLMYFGYSWPDSQIHRRPATLHPTEMAFLGVALVAACYVLPPGCYHSVQQLAERIRQFPKIPN